MSKITKIAAGVRDGIIALPETERVQLLPFKCDGGEMVHVVWHSKRLEGKSIAVTYRAGADLGTVKNELDRFIEVIRRAPFVPPVYRHYDLDGPVGFDMRIAT